MQHQLPSPEQWQEAASTYRDFQRRFPEIADELAAGRLRFKHQREAFAKKLRWGTPSLEFYLSKLRRDLKRVVKPVQMMTVAGQLQRQVRHAVLKLDDVDESMKKEKAKVA